jgi:hypothetical protein
VENPRLGHRILLAGLIPAASKAETGSIIRAAFAQQKVVCYVLIVAASSEGKQYVLFTPEDEFGLMVGH